MQVQIGFDELASAPVEVRSWFAGRMGFGVKTDPVAKPAKKEEPKPEVKPEVKEEPAPSADEVLEKARVFMEAKGQALLVQVLGKLGLKRVSDCPVEMRARLLSELATHA